MLNVYCLKSFDTEEIWILICCFSQALVLVPGVYTNTLPIQRGLNYCIPKLCDIGKNITILHNELHLNMRCTKTNAIQLKTNATITSIFNSFLAHLNRGSSELFWSPVVRSPSVNFSQFWLFLRTTSTGQF